MLLTVLLIAAILLFTLPVIIPWGRWLFGYLVVSSCLLTALWLLSSFEMSQAARAGHHTLGDVFGILLPMALTLLHVAGFGVRLVVLAIRSLTSPPSVSDQ